METEIKIKVCIFYIGKLILSRSLDFEEVKNINSSIGAKWELNKIGNEMELFVSKELNEEYLSKQAFNDLSHIIGCIKKDVKINGLINIYFPNSEKHIGLEVINNRNERRREMVSLKLIYDSTTKINDIPYAY